MTCDTQLSKKKMFGATSGIGAHTNTNDPFAPRNKNPGSIHSDMRRSSKERHRSRSKESTQIKNWSISFRRKKSNNQNLHKCGGGSHHSHSASQRSSGGHNLAMDLKPTNTLPGLAPSSRSPLGVNVSSPRENRLMERRQAIGRSKSVKTVNQVSERVMSDAERKSLKESLSVLDMLCSQAAAERA